MAGSSQFSWLDNLNALEVGSNQPQPAGGALGGAGQQQGAGDALPDELRAQLEAWTTVTFGNDSGSSLSPASGPPGSGDIGPGFDAEYALKDPSPYAKRPFGNFGHNYGLERGFNSFDHSSGSNNGAAGSLSEIYAGLGFPNSTEGGDIVNGNSFAGDALFDVSGSAAQDPIFAAIMQQPDEQPVQASGRERKTRKASSRDADAVDAAPSTTKKQRTSSSSAAATPAVSPETPAPASATASPAPTTGGNMPKAPLSKAAILAAQLAELEAKKGLTPEEEAARQAELNRIAAEDDKRRRNTAASARFRVKKKQREQALEETVKGLNERIDKLEKDLEASRNENNFLRDLVIRKIGLSELAAPSAGGRISGGQEGTTGMGTTSI